MHGAVEVGSIAARLASAQEPDQEEALGAGGIGIVLQRCGPEIGVHHVAGVLVQRCYPRRKFCCI